MISLFVVQNFTITQLIEYLETKDI